jgi:hypothetical protein
MLMAVGDRLGKTAVASVGGGHCCGVAAGAAISIVALHAAHSAIAAASRSWSIWSGWGTHACAIASTAACTVAGAECRRKAFGEIAMARVKLRAHRAACGTCASTARL